MSNSDIRVHDLVVNVGDRSVVGEVLATSQAEGGLHPAADLDVWDTGARPRYRESGKVPVIWNHDGAPYEWWEDPENLEVVRSSDIDRGAPAVH